MTTKTTTTTISMEALNKLYFQFLERYVMPNLIKIVAEVQNLLQIKNTYEVYRYLEEMTKEVQAIQSISPINTNINNHFPPKNPNYYQYALPTIIDNQKSHNLNHNNSISNKTQQSAMNFKNKSSSKKSTNSNTFQQLPKAFDLYRNKSEEEPSHRLTKHPSVNVDYQSDFKIQYNAIRNTAYVPSISSSKRIQSRENLEVRPRDLKQIVKKLSKIFNENHSKIQKYNKNNETNKLYVLNVSTKIQKRDDLKNINSLK